MGDCHLPFNYNEAACAEKYCKYSSYSPAQWCERCETCERGLPPRRRAKSESSESSRRRSKEMKISSPRKYLKSQEYENMDLEYENWYEPHVDVENYRIRSNLCELPTSYISNNYQSTIIVENNIKLYEPNVKFVDVNHEKFKSTDDHLGVLQKYKQNPIKPQSSTIINTVNNHKSTNLLDNHYALAPCDNNHRNYNFKVEHFNTSLAEAESAFSYNTATYFDKMLFTSTFQENYAKEIEEMRARLAAVRAARKNTPQLYCTDGHTQDGFNRIPGIAKYQHTVSQKKEEKTEKSPERHVRPIRDKDSPQTPKNKEKPFRLDTNGLILFNKTHRTSTPLYHSSSHKEKSPSPPPRASNFSKNNSAHYRSINDYKEKTPSPKTPNKSTETSPLYIKNLLLRQRTLTQEKPETPIQKFPPIKVEVSASPNTERGCPKAYSPNFLNGKLLNRPISPDKPQGDSIPSPIIKDIPRNFVTSKPEPEVKLTVSRCATKKLRAIKSRRKLKTNTAVKRIKSKIGSKNNFERSASDSDLNEEPPEVLGDHATVENIYPPVENLKNTVGDCSEWPLRPSLFPNVPPYIKFATHDDPPIKLLKGRRYMRWELSTITPILVRKTIINTGFVMVRSELDETEGVLPATQIIPKNSKSSFNQQQNNWLGTWGKHMKSQLFRTLRDYQKLNHFPGTFHLGRKDRLWRNFQKMISKYGLREFGFIPQCFILPQELKILKQSWDYRVEDGNSIWILKPPAAARGSGIRVVNKWSQIPKKTSLVVQKYIINPYLINGNKFDLRLYVLVTSFNPLRIYLYPEGLARFASAKYSDAEDDLKDRYMHLTNYSINKLSSQYTANQDANACQGHKWTLTKLFEYMRAEHKINTRQLWRNLQQLVIKTFISAESPIVALCDENLLNCYNCYELFGVDVLLDDTLKPWLLEVNISPSLQSSSALDAQVKGPLVQSVFDLAQFNFPTKLYQAVRSSPTPYDPRIFSMFLTRKDRDKHESFIQFTNRKDYLDDILMELSGDDVRRLIQAEDEFVAKGRFERIFPTSYTYRYFKFMEPRYYNMLFDAWETKYESDRQKGVDVLRRLCEEKVHLNSLSVTNLDKNSPNLTLAESKENQPTQPTVKQEPQSLPPQAVAVE